MSLNNNFQGRSRSIGNAFKKECMTLLDSMGFVYRNGPEILYDYGVQIDFVYDNKKGISLFFEAAGTIEDDPVSDRPGLERTDTTKKRIATALLISRATGNPVIILTSHTPCANLSSGKMLNKAGRHMILDVICIYEEKDIERLEKYLNMNSQDLDKLVADDERPLF